jgi:hypothetical protein
MHSRSDPTTLIPAARALAERGTAPHDVVGAIYGVDLPREAWLLERDIISQSAGDSVLQLDVLWGTLPWELMIPIERGGPRAILGPRLAAVDAAIYKAAPELIPLGRMGYRPTEVSGSYLAYSIDELRAGRSTVLACHRDEVDRGAAKFRIVGPSLLEVLRVAIVDYIEHVEADHEHGDGADLAELDGAKAHLPPVERLLLELAS